MRYLTRRPRGPLADFVSEFWLYSGYRPPHRFERILPTGTVELVINLFGQPLRCYGAETLEPVCAVDGPLLSGARTGHSVVDTGQQREIMGVHFRPGGAAAVLGMPVDELEGADVSLEAVWGAEAGRLHDRLMTEARAERRLAILERCMAERLRPGMAAHPVLGAALSRLDRTDEPVEIRSLAAEAGWSARRFIRAFHAQVGITPKAYARIRRFQAALGRIGAEPDWADIAVASGYYDQAHFIRDFREFSGITPSAYARLQAGHLQHVPVAEHAQICPVGEPPRLRTT